MMDFTGTGDEQQRRLLQKYIFELEEAQEKAEEISIAHEQLKRSQDLVLSILSSPIYGIALIKKSQVVWCNKGLTNILGWEQAEIIGQSIEIIFKDHKDFIRIGEKIWNKVSKTGFVSYEYPYLHKNGHMVSCLITGCALDPNDFSKGFVFLCIDFSEKVKARDALQKAHEELELRVQERTAQLAKANEELLNEIDERKHAEKSARESEEKYRTILENMEDGYFEVDLSGCITFFNKSLYQRLGYAPDEMMGMSYRDITDEATAKKLYQIFNKVFLTGKPGKASDYLMLAKNGTEFLIETPVSLMRNEKGDPIGFRGLARDVTETRDLERQLHRAQKMEAIGSLAGGVAHDLNNILSGIVSYPELILMELPEDSPLRKPVSTVKKSGEKAVAIVQDLLTLARRSVAIKEVTNLNKILEEYLKSPEYFKLKSFHPWVQVRTDLTGNLGNISGSPVHLFKTVMNLVSNAAEAIPKDGAIWISTENVYVNGPKGAFEDVANGHYAVLKIKDNGIGIAQDDVSKIFEPFYTKKKMGRSGTGLGMAVVWGTMKDHNGYIDVKSIEGHGTTFILYFPITWKEEEKVEDVLSIEDYKGNGEAILIIDDVEEQRDIAASMLEKLDYSVQIVSSGEGAIEYMKDHSADLLILDMIMDPGMDGFDTYSQIVEMHPGQKAIIVSGFSETKRVRDAQKRGAGPYLKKPYTLEEIGLAVKKELGKR